MNGFEQEFLAECLSQLLEQRANDISCSAKEIINSWIGTINGHLITKHLYFIKDGNSTTIEVVKPENVNRKNK